MIKNKFLEYLIESPLVYYIYNRGSIIYGLQQSNSDIDFLVICDKEFQVSEEFKEHQNKNKHLSNHCPNVVYDNCNFVFKDKESWFNLVLNCDVEAWECACLPKKFIHKEYVKLLLTRNPLKLRKQCDLMFESAISITLNNSSKEGYYDNKKYLWDIIKTYAFSNQIIENHKIVDFKEVSGLYKSFVLNDSIDNQAILECWLDVLKPYKEKVENLTDGILKSSRLKKIIQNGKWIK